MNNGKRHFLMAPSSMSPSHAVPTHSHTPSASFHIASPYTMIDIHTPTFTQCQLHLDCDNKTATREDTMMKALGNTDPAPSCGGGGGEEHYQRRSTEMKQSSKF